MATVRVTLSQVQWSQTYQNVFHLFDGATPYDPLAVKTAIETYWIPAVKVQQLSSLQYQVIAVKGLSGGGTPTTLYSVTINGSGGSGTESWGPLSQLFSLQTSTAGRTGRGRLYIGGTSSVNVAQGRWITAMQTAMDGIATNLMTRFTGATPTSGFNLIVIPRDDPTDYKMVTNIIARNIPGVIRRRNIGVGI